MEFPRFNSSLLLAVSAAGGCAMVARYQRHRMAQESSVTDNAQSVSI
jgi:hypothetical protein